MTDKPTWKDMHIGNIITDPGNASFRRTGDWRTEKPVLDKDCA